MGGPTAPPLQAGPFRAWLTAFNKLHRSLRTNSESGAEATASVSPTPTTPNHATSAGQTEHLAENVPCDGCTACCRSGMFIHIAADEHEAVAHIPSALLFAAPGYDNGTRILAQTQEGKCPMLGAQGCEIYAHRPRTCRTFDCRLFAATGTAEPAETDIDRRALQWRFNYPDPDEQALHQACRQAADYLQLHKDKLPPQWTGSRTQRAMAAIRIHDLFLNSSTPDSPESREQASQELHRRISDRLVISPAG